MICANPNPKILSLFQAPPKPSSVIPQLINTGAGGTVGGSTFITPPISGDKK